MRLLERVMSVVLERILPRLLDSDDIGANDSLFTQKLGHHYILRSVHVVLIYLKFLWCVLLTVVIIHWRFDREDFLLCILRLPAERMLRERSSL